MKHHLKSCLIIFWGVASTITEQQHKHIHTVAELKGGHMPGEPDHALINEYAHWKAQDSGQCPCCNNPDLGNFQVLEVAGSVFSNCGLESSCSAAHLCLQQLVHPSEALPA